jgi:hypothetical protein
MNMNKSGDLWLAAAVVSGGVGVALAFGAGAASADTGDSDSDTGTKSSSYERSDKPERPRSLVRKQDAAPERVQSHDRADDDERAAAVAPRRTTLVRVTTAPDDEKPSRALVKRAAQREDAVTLARAPRVDTAEAAAPVAEPLAAAAAPAVTVGNSDLRLAPGVDVDADWYFPNAGAEPVGMIYLNHGNFRTNNNMEALANALARDTNSVVVAPSVSTNAFNPYRITASRTYSAITGLFGTDRAALNASAAAAGYTGSSLPTDFVLAGHSFGGNLVTAVGGMIGTSSTLKGILLLDAANNGSDMATGLSRLDAGVPVYQIAAAPRLINGFGSTTALLARSRPEEFVGVRIVGGSHVDAEGASSDFLGGLTGGFSKSRDAAALQTIAAGWVTDMFNETGNGKGAGLYPSAGQSVSVGSAVVVGLG